ncbi:MAG: hypothetical protein ACNS63_02275 [Candidatus Nitrospinota bacterium M3_3B_026]
MAGKRDEKSSAPLGALIILSLVFPGAGQLAIGRKVIGWLFAGAAIVLLGAFFIQLSAVVPRFFAAISSGEAPVADDKLIGGIRTLFYIVAGLLVVWITAFVDVMIAGRRRGRR